MSNDAEQHATELIKQSLDENGMLVTTDNPAVVRALAHRGEHTSVIISGSDNWGRTWSVQAPLISDTPAPTVKTVLCVGGPWDGRNIMALIETDEFTLPDGTYRYRSGGSNHNIWYWRSAE